MVDQLIERAAILFEQKRYTDAEKIISEVLAAEPQNLDCLQMLAEIKIQNDEYANALKIIDNAIGQHPDYDVLFYTKSRILFALEKIDEALKTIDNAIELDPNDTNNYAFKGHILNVQKKFEDGLSFANMALEIDPSNVFALNVRSTALLKLNRKEDSFTTIEGALNEDPNNSYTHANYGWGLLEKGDVDKSLTHFSEALKQNPNNEYAQSGMAEALKSKYLIYKWFLKYAFWMESMSSKNQWVFIIGFYIGTKILRAIAKSNEFLQPYLTPIIILLAIFAFSTWVLVPISNLLFRLNKYGKHLLTSEEIKSSNMVGVSSLIMFLGLITLIFNTDLGTLLIAFGFSMMVPLGKFYEKPILFFKSYAVGMALIGITALITYFITNEMFNTFSFIYLISFIAYQWLANFMINKYL